MLRNLRFNLKWLEREEDAALEPLTVPLSVPEKYRSTNTKYGKASIVFEQARKPVRLWKTLSGVSFAVGLFWLLVPLELRTDSGLLSLVVGGVAFLFYFVYKLQLQLQVAQLLIHRYHAAMVVQKCSFQELARIRYGETEANRFFKVWNRNTAITFDLMDLVDQERRRLGLSEAEFFERASRMLEQAAETAKQEHDNKNPADREEARQFLSEDYLGYLQRISSSFDEIL